MLVVLRKMIIKAGHEEKVIDKFNSQGILEKQEGFIDRSLLVEKSRKDEIEMVIMVRWESEAAWKQWEKSDAHIAGHKANLGKPKPDHIVSIEVKKYHVQATKEKE